MTSPDPLPFHVNEAGIVVIPLLASGPETGVKLVFFVNVQDASKRQRPERRDSFMINLSSDKIWLTSKGVGNADFWRGDLRRYSPFYLGLIARVQLVPWQT